MAASQEARSNLYYAWTLGESGWNTGMDTNLLQLGRAYPNWYVTNRTTTDPTTLTPSDGDAYIVGPSATGDWATHDDDIAVYDGSAWVFYTPVNGWTAVITAEKREVLFTTVWEQGIRVDGLSGTLDKALTDANTTLAATEYRQRILRFTGTLTAARNIVVPITDGGEWIVYNNTTGGFGLQVIGATGTGITVAATKHAIVYADGTNIVRVTADT